MNDGTIRTAILALASVGGLAVICIAILIVVLKDLDVAALAVLASIASAAVGGVAGMISPARSQQTQNGDTPRNDAGKNEANRSTEIGSASREA